MLSCTFVCISLPAYRLALAMVLVVAFDLNELCLAVPMKSG